MCALDAQGKFSEFTIATLIESMFQKEHNTPVLLTRAFEIGAVLPNLVWYTGRTTNSTRNLHSHVG